MAGAPRKGDMVRIMRSEILAGAKIITSTMEWWGRGVEIDNWEPKPDDKKPINWWQRVCKNFAIAFPHVGGSFSRKKRRKVISLEIWLVLKNGAKQNKW